MMCLNTASFVESYNSKDKRVHTVWQIVDYNSCMIE